MSDEKGTDISGVVTRFYPSEEENKPHGVYVDGDRYTTFEDDDVEDLEEGAAVRFRYVQNGDHRNIVPNSIEIVDAEAVLRSAVLHHQHREDSTDEDIVATAERFADAQVALYQKLRDVGQQEGEA